MFLKFNERGGLDSGKISKNLINFPQTSINYLRVPSFTGTCQSKLRLEIDTRPVAQFQIN